MRNLIAAVAACFLLAAGPALAKPLQYVRDAQRLLGILGYNVGELDGEFDAEFETALNHFKRDERLPPDGRLDAATREAMNKAFANRGTRTQPSPQVVAVQPIPPQPTAPAPQPAYEPAAPMPPVSAAPPPPQSVPASAAAPAPSYTAPAASDPFLGFVVEIAAEFGGDDVATVLFTDGSTQDVKSGDGVTLSLGGLFRTGAEDGFTVRATAGYKFVSTQASNADIELTRIAAELVGGWTFPSGLWLGVGPVYHSNIEFDGGGVGPNLDFENAVGGTVEIGWRWLAATYTFIDYEDEFGGEYDAGNAGLMFSYAFGG